MAAADQANYCSKLDLKILSLNISGLRNKTCYLKQIISKHRPDFICLQETNISDKYYENKALYDLGLDKNNCVFNYPSTKSNGTAIFCTSHDIKINYSFCLDEGRTIILKVEKGKIHYTIVNVYAPTNQSQRPDYFINLFSHLENIQNRQNLIIAGDFNITLQDIDNQGEGFLAC